MEVGQRVYVVTHDCYGVVFRVTDDEVTVRLTSGEFVHVDEDDLELADKEA